MNNPYRQVIQDEIEARLKARDLITDSELKTRQPQINIRYAWVNGFIAALEWMLEQDSVQVIE